ncbi:hypothetical protein B0H66DRAFT_388367 [Apodospora peruviana]|uniref:Uncharacterized protein n=1 Tax=Apodospora peruviana TaxID=516989 RepID=A0AAE0HUM8_9PEZI|nr:hypothetical protein B0H66DRAFT_388367 [Apodospora peruviana]
MLTVSSSEVGDIRDCPCTLLIFEKGWTRKSGFKIPGPVASRLLLACRFHACANCGGGTVGCLKLLVHTCGATGRVDCAQTRCVVYLIRSRLPSLPSLLFFLFILTLIGCRELKNSLHHNGEPALHIVALAVINCPSGPFRSQFLMSNSFFFTVIIALCGAMGKKFSLSFFDG